MSKIPVVVATPQADPFDGFWTMSFSVDGKAISQLVTRSQRQVYELIRDLYLDGFWGDPATDGAVAQAITAEYQFAMRGWQESVG